MSTRDRRLTRLEQVVPKSEQVLVLLPWNGRDPFPTEPQTGPLIEFRSEEELAAILASLGRGPKPGD